MFSLGFAAGFIFDSFLFLSFSWKPTVSTPFPLVNVECSCRMLIDTVL